jgi:Flp pilus assembly pilin Flp
VFRRMFRAVAHRFDRLREEVGQTTAEYALVILGAAAVATLLITWATKSHAVGKLFDEVIGKVLQ